MLSIYKYYTIAYLFIIYTKYIYILIRIYYGS